MADCGGDIRPNRPVTSATVLITCPPALATADSFVPGLKARGLDVRLASVIQQPSEEDLIRLLQDVEGVIAGDDPLTSRVLRQAPKLRVIVRWGVGVDNVDLTEARKLGIRVVNTPGVFGDEVADVAIGYLILLARHLHRIDCSVRHGVWEKPQGRSLAGRTIGIIGLGTIGQAVARRAAAMRMVVVGHDVVAHARDTAAAQGVRIEPFDDLVARADVIVLCTALTSENRHLINATTLARMRPGGWLINVARGALVDEGALVAALKSGFLAGAALDVFESEPLSIDSPLQAFDQLILGSHNASNTVEAVARVNELAVDHLIRGLAEVSR